MTHHYDINDAEFEQLLAGRQRVDESEIDETAQFVHDLRDFCIPANLEGIRERHLAAIRAALAEPAPAALPQTRGAITAIGASGAATIRTALTQSLGGITTKAAALAAAMLLSTAGLAAAGVLPAPVQTAIAQAAARIGLEVPGLNEAVPDLPPAPEIPVPVPSAAAVLPTELPLDQQAVEQQVIAASQQVIGVAESVTKASQDAVAAAQDCLDQVLSQLQILTGQIAATGNGTGTLPLIQKAQSLGEEAGQCTAQAAAAGTAGIAQVEAAEAEAHRLASLISIPAGATQDATRQARAAADAAKGAANSALSAAGALADTVAQIAGQLASAPTVLPAPTSPVPQSEPAPVVSFSSPSGATQTPPPGLPGLGAVEQLLNSFLLGTGL